MIIDLIFSVGLIGGLMGIGGVAVVLSKDMVLLRRVSHVLTDIACALIIATITLHALMSSNKGMSSIKLYDFIRELLSESPTVNFSMLLSDPFVQTIGVLMLGVLYKWFVDKMLGFKIERKVDKPNE